MFNIVIIDSMSHLRARLERRERHLMRGIINDALQPGRMVIWCWEGANGSGNNARRAILPGYKNRPPSPATAMLQLGLCKDLLSYTPAWQAYHEGFEGDDVIAALVNHFRGPDVSIEILSSDGDLTALCGPGVVCKAKCPVTPNLVPLYKLTVGDSSDTIPGIKGFGPKSWAAVPDPRRLQLLLDDVMSGAQWRDGEAALCGLGQSHINWIRENPHQLRAMRQVIAPLPMTPDQFNACLHQGRDNPAARAALMQEYML